MRRWRQRLGCCVYKPRVPKLASNHQKLGERERTDAPAKPPEGTNPAKTLILDFKASELTEYVSVVLSHLVCGYLL